MENFEEADKNLRGFLEKYGSEGFLKLFFTNYLVDLVSYYVQTRGKTKDEDPGYLFHFDIKGEPHSQEKNEKFHLDLRKVCSEYSNTIVETLKQSYNLEELASKPLDPETRVLLDSAFEKIIKKFEE